MNRIILKIKLTSDKSAKITLVYVDKRVLADFGKDSFKYFYDESNNFMIYSFDNFSSVRDALKLPSKDKYIQGETIDIEFTEEEKLKNWLKRLYNTLNSWNDNYTIFKKFDDYDSRPKKLILNKENWIL